jgi:hypothetical protein
MSTPDFSADAVTPSELEIPFSSLGIRQTRESGVKRVALRTRKWPR